MARAIRAAGMGPHERHVKVTTLANGLRVASDAMPRRARPASLGVWVDVGTRHEPAEVNGVAHMLEHMAFKGTRAPLGPRHRRGDRERRRQPQRLYRRASTPPTTPGAEGGRGARASTCSPTSCSTRRSIPTSCSASAASSCRRSARRTTRPTTWSSTSSRTTAFPGQPLGRPVLGTAEIVAAMPRDGSVDYMARHYGPQQHGAVGGRAGSSTTSSSSSAERLFRRAAAHAGRCRRRCRARYVGGDGREDARSRAGASRAGLRGHRLSRSRLLRARRCSRPLLGGGMSSRLFQEVAREARPGLLRSTPSPPPMPTPACSASMPAPARTIGRAGAGGVRRDPRSCRRRPSEDELVRARAQLKAGLLMALESCFARPRSSPASCSLRPAHPARRDRRQDRCGRPGGDPPGRPPPAARAAPRRSPRSARSPTCPTLDSIRRRLQ